MQIGARLTAPSPPHPELVRFPWLRFVPWGLVLTRLVLTPVAVWLAFEDLRALWVLQGALATLSDIYDGKLARRWGVVSGGLRQSDSICDTIYALGVAASFWIAEPEIVTEHAWGIGLVIALEAARYPLDWWRFGRGASYHANSARAFGVSLLAPTVLIMGFGYAGPWLWIALAVGIYSELEGIAMSLVLPRWTHDVKHIGVAWRIRQEWKAQGSPAIEGQTQNASLLTRYRAMPENVRMAATAVLGAGLGLLIYEAIYWLMPFHPRAPLSWTLAYLIGVARQHALHRWLTFHSRASPYWKSLGRAYVMYSGSLLVGAGLDWWLTSQWGVHHRLAWLVCLCTTAAISFFFLKRFVFVSEKP